MTHTTALTGFSVVLLLSPAAALAGCAGLSAGVISSKFSEAARSCGGEDAVSEASAAPVVHPQGMDLLRSVAVRYEAPVPRRSTPRRYVRGGHDPIVRVSQRYGIDPLLMHAIVSKESAYRPGAVSSKGALGLMQVMPATARSLGVSNPSLMLTDTELSLSTGASYLKLMQRKFGNDVPAVLAAYNAGPGAVKRYGSAVPYAETRGLCVDDHDAVSQSAPDTALSAERFLNLGVPGARSSTASRFADVILVAGVVSIIGLMILPLPYWLIDTLVAFNITFGVLLLLTTLYVKTPLDFSAFPSILLVTTLFRLALSVATTRMILLNAHAGEIITAFGTMVAGGNLVVGIVVYIIIVVVQFIVIAKGAERVAEVAARFSLDSMPGKQLSIDSDLRSGLIDKDEARRRRRTLELESKLHGSLDGAMKFVKGDAIASIVIVIINLIGGMAIGVFQRDMDFGAAAHTYSILTIGEGLVAQIPALLSAMAAGLLVTRSTDEEKSQHLGEAIRFQLAANPRVLIFVGGIAMLMALVPGFPASVFIGLGAALMVAGAATHPRLKPRFDRLVGPFQAQIQRGPAPPPATLLAAPAEPKPLVPLLLQLQMPQTAEAAGSLNAALTGMLDTLQYRVGVPLPSMSLHFETAADEDRRWTLLAFETPIGSGSFDGGEDGTAALTAAVRDALRRNLATFMGVQETTTILNRVGTDYPEVVKEAVRTVPTTRIAEVMRRLLEEEVPLRNMRDVLEGIAEAGAQEREPARIADITRVALKRYLIAAYATDGQLRALIVSSELEDMIRGAVRTIDGVERLAFEPDQARDLVAAITSAAESTGARVLLTGFDIRRAVRKLIEPDLFDLPVLAFNELTPNVKLDVLGQVRMPVRALGNSSALAAE